MSDVTVTVDTAPVTIVVSGAQGSPLANSVDFLSFDTTPTGVPTRTGTASWNATEGALDLQLGDGVTLQIGSAEQVEKCHNNTGSTIAEGKVVYVAGATGLVPKIALASSASDVTSKATLGIVTQTGGIANGAEGWVTLRGKVRGIDTNAFSAGDELWLTTAGDYTNSQPSKAAGPNHTVRVGYVVRKAGAGSGIVFVDPLIGEELGDLHDVLISSPTNNQALLYETATGLWKNGSVTSAVISDAASAATGSTVAKRTADGDASFRDATAERRLVAGVSGVSDGAIRLFNSAGGQINIQPHSSFSANTYIVPTSGGYLAISSLATGMIPLDELHDVTLTEPADKEVLAYDSGTGLWKNAAPDHFIPPTSDPLVAGAVWNNAGTLTISAG